MRMREAERIMTANNPKPKGFRVRFHWVLGKQVRGGDYFPEGVDEPLIADIDTAWVLAERFAKASKGKTVDVYVVDSEGTPVADYRTRVLNREYVSSATHVAPFNLKREPWRSQHQPTAWRTRPETPLPTDHWSCTYNPTHTKSWVKERFVEVEPRTTWEAWGGGWPHDPLDYSGRGRVNDEYGHNGR